MSLDKESVRGVSRLEDVIPALLGVSLNGGNGSREPRILCPFHDDRTPSLRVNLQKQVWRCDPCDAGGDVFDLVQRVLHVDFAAALQWLADRAHVTPTERTIEATYDYHDAQGVLVFQVVRFQPKDFRQRRADGNGGWIWNMQGVRRVLYRLDRLKGREAVVIVEGEKDVDALWTLKLPATTNAGGAGKWREDYAQQLVTAGVKRVLVIPDHDEPGREHAQTVARSCAAAGLSVKMLALPDLPPKGDVSDYLAAHTRDDLIDLLKSAPPFDPSVAVKAPIVVDRGGPIVVCLADVQPEDIAWVWPNRLARGKLTLLLGDPGVGKSTLSLDVIARITRGREWPEGGRAPEGSAILLACEDGLADTIRPRLDRQDAHAHRVFALQAARAADGTERHFSLERDLPQLAAAIEQYAPVIVVLDPLSAYFGTGRDSYKDTEVRAVLAPLVSLAEHTGTAILGLMHLTKASQQKALYRALGSIAFTASARIVLAAGKDPAVDRYLLMASKQNICPPSATLAYSIGLDRRLQWEADPVQGVNVDAVLSGSAQLPDEDQQNAAEFLRELLTGGGLMKHEDVVKAGARHGFSASQLQRAKRTAGVTSKKGGFSDVWYWRLQGSLEQSVQPAEDDAKTSKMTRTCGSVIFDENPPASALESTPFSKVTGVSSSTSSSGTVLPSEDGWGEV